MLRSRRLPVVSRNDVVATKLKVQGKVRKLIVQTAFEDLLKKRIPNKAGVLSIGYGEYTNVINKYHEIGHTWLKR
jgi:hypothetical protein